MIAPIYSTTICIVGLTLLPLTAVGRMDIVFAFSAPLVLADAVGADFRFFALSVALSVADADSEVITFWR